MKAAKRATADLLHPAAPRLREGLAVFALDGNRVRIGLAEPVVFDDLTADEAAFVSRLEGPPWSTPTDAARYPHVVRRLRRRGLLQEADPAQKRRKRTPVEESSVCVIGADNLGTAVALCLAQAGVGRVVVDDDTRVSVLGAGALTASATRAQAAVRDINGRAPQVAQVAGHSGVHSFTDVAVVVASGGPSVALICDLMAADQPHLPVISDEKGITVGPLVVPGDGPCITCMGIRRTELDPDWPLVALQCNGARLPHAPAAVRAIAAGVACDAIVRYLHGHRADPRQWRIECLEPGGSLRPIQGTPGDGGTTSLRGGPRVTEHAVSPHPSCRCADPLVIRDDFEDLEAILF